MNMKASIACAVFFISALGVLSFAGASEQEYTYKAGHESLQVWLMPKQVPAPENNKLSDERVALGKMLFFDTRLSGDGNMSCATCHNPLFGWSDGLRTAKGFKSKVLPRSTPTIINTAYNPFQMWDGHLDSLEAQAIGPMLNSNEMNIALDQAIEFLTTSPDYQKAFSKAYPNEEISVDTLAKAIASFERTVVSRNSPFDRWVAGDKKALNKQQVQGFELFVRADKGNCAVCHSAPNFTDNGFHNVGLDSFYKNDPDLGRYSVKPIGIMKGAFKTPTLRDISLTAPYFHDGSASTLSEVVEHYAEENSHKENLSPNMKSIKLSDEETLAIVEFMKALSSPQQPFLLPILSNPEDGYVSNK
ncbi:cytochrome-c peroxidase [Aurantivibrio infirmus]